MALVELKNLSKQFEAQKILCDVEFQIEENERVAIVGKNGSGKSTLMKIVAGLLPPDEGVRRTKQNLTVKMLSQKPDFPPETTVKEEIENQLKELKAAKREYLECAKRLEKDPQNKALLDKLNTISNFLDYHNAWNLEDKIQRVLEEFDLKRYENKNVNSLSGGEQRRVALAGLLLQKPDLLLLDEPTNHLDVYMVEFLEEMLLKESFSLLFISHDRYFIENIATRVIEIEECKIRSFRGGYLDYLNKKEELLKSLQKKHENLLRLLKQEEEWLRRGVKARTKRNEGRKKRVFQLREEAKKNPSIIKKIKLELEREKHNFNREKSVNRKKMLFELENVTKKVDSKVLINGFSTRILQRDKIAIVGKNGVGKSTLLKILTGEIDIDGGSIRTGDFKIGYFDQHRTMLDDDKNLIETFCPQGGDRVSVRGKNMHVYGYLKNFLFPKEFLDKKIGVLSGGEKNRVALALLFTKDVDCLILDEPTNDLDIPTINILEEYISTFEGAVIFVSHDRYFVDKLANRLFIFKGDGIIEESYQSYSEYLLIEKELKEIEGLEKKIKPKVKRERQRTPKLSYKETKLLQELPAKIESYENEIEKINECLADPECYEREGISNLAEKLQKLQSEYDSMVELYLELEEKRENIQKATKVADQNSF